MSISWPVEVCVAIKLGCSTASDFNSWSSDALLARESWGKGYRSCILTDKIFFTRYNLRCFKQGFSCLFQNTGPFRWWSALVLTCWGVRFWRYSVTAPGFLEHTKNTITQLLYTLMEIQYHIISYIFEYNRHTFVNIVYIQIIFYKYIHRINYSFLILPPRCNSADPVHLLGGLSPCENRLFGSAFWAFSTKTAVIKTTASGLYQPERMKLRDVFSVKDSSNNCNSDDYKVLKKHLAHRCSGLA